MSTKTDLRLSFILTQWYEKNKRDLPWRHTSDPYRIWISEIILQQTRVDQGLDYFNRFIERFPSVSFLAKADESEVLKLWQGLGYYSRARNIHATAKVIMETHDGIFPSVYKDVLDMKGVGKYTAAAIMSFAYNEAYATVDGNVYRVLSRIFAIDEPINSTVGEKLFAELAQSLIDKNNPGLHNQAIMEFGALQCVPVSPNCEACPAQTMCLAYAKNKVGGYPIKKGKQKIRNRYFNYLDIRHDDEMLLHKRTAKDIWHNLYELPLIETKEEFSADQLISDSRFKDLFGSIDNLYIKYIRRIKHILSHQIIYATFYKVEVDYLPEVSNCQKINTSEVDGFPVSRLVNKYLSE